MVTYDEIVKLINYFILYRIMFNHRLGRNRFKTKSYAKSAMLEILEMVGEEKKVYGDKIDILKVIDGFVHMMDRFMRIKFNPIFNTERRTAILFKQYLIEEKGENLNVL